MSKLTAQDIAEYFLSMVNEEEGDFMSNLKLQKLLYYAQGFNLAIFGERLFDERIEAWNLGPVVVDVYESYKKCESNPIHFDPDSFDPDKFDKDTIELLDEVYGVYGQYSASALVNMTHEEAPWEETPARGEIDVNLMRKFFKGLLTDGEST